MFYQSLISDWNHGNAHFLRGVASELMARGHEVVVYEPKDSWSVENLVAEHGEEAITEFELAYPHLNSVRYRPDELDLDLALDGHDLVIVHEWNDPELITRIGQQRRGMDFCLFFHDTHHRLACSEQGLPFELTDYDGVLAYGQVIADRYLIRGWTSAAWVWHEAADTRVFHPLPHIERTEELVCVGNWGDNERSAEMREFLLQPVKNLRLEATIYGVRYPEAAVREMRAAKISYRGWLPNFRVPEVFARHRVTLHIPRRPYVETLPGIPTIRPFEALACGIPLICSPWDDRERLFTPGKDFLIARNGQEMQHMLAEVLHNQSLADELALHGLTTILEKHTCAHRVDQLLSIYDGCRADERHEWEAAWAAN